MGKPEIELEWAANPRGAKLTLVTSDRDAVRNLEALRDAIIEAEELNVTLGDILRGKQTGPPPEPEHWQGTSNVGVARHAARMWRARCRWFEAECERLRSGLQEIRDEAEVDHECSTWIEHLDRILLGSRAEEPPQ